MGYSIRHQEKFIVTNSVSVPPGGEVVDMDHQERKVHHQIHKLRAEDSKLGVDTKEVLVNGNYRIVGGGDDSLQRVASVALFSRPAVLPASPLGGKTHSSRACLFN